MNLSEYLSGNNKNIDLDTHALVFDENLDSILNNIQNDHNSKFRVKSLPLSDNRKFLLANLLKEINNDGIYGSVFTLLPEEYFYFVEIVPISEISNFFQTDI